MIFFLRRWFAHREHFLVKLINVLILALALNFIFGLLFYLAEHQAQEELTFGDSLWWAMVTMTTVGYGDYYATTWIGRFLISYPCFIIGIGAIGYLLGIVAEGIMERISRKRRGLMKMKYNRHIIICNCPSVEKVIRLVTELRSHSANQNAPVVVIADNLEEVPAQFSKSDIDFIHGRPISEEILDMANINTCSGVIVLARTPGDSNCDAETFTTGSIIEQIGDDRNIDIKSVVELVSHSNARMMSRAHTDGVVIADGLADRLMVQEFLYPGTRQVFEQLLTNTHGSEFYIVDTKLVDLPFVELQIAVLKHPKNIQIIGLIRNGDSMLNVEPSMKIETNDKLIILAETPQSFANIESEMTTHFNQETA